LFALQHLKNVSTNLVSITKIRSIYSGSCDQNTYFGKLIESWVAGFCRKSEAGVGGPELVFVYYIVTCNMWSRGYSLTDL